MNQCSQDAGLCLQNIGAKILHVFLNLAQNYCGHKPECIGFFFKLQFDILCNKLVWFPAEEVIQPITPNQQ